jgi:hypothetical protein
MAYVRWKNGGVGSGENAELENQVGLEWPNERWKIRD